MSISHTQTEILLVEDNPGDIRLAKEACSEFDIPIEIHVAKDGQEAITFLKQMELSTHVPHPHLILLDLNLPAFDGRDVLKFIKTHPTLKLIPVIILTTSKSDEDIAKSYEYHANAYVQKPVDLDGFIPMMQSLLKFWVHIVQLPDM